MTLHDVKPFVKPINIPNAFVGKVKILRIAM